MLTTYDSLYYDRVFIVLYFYGHLQYWNDNKYSRDHRNNLCNSSK